MRPEIALHYTPEVIARALESFEVVNSKILSQWHAMTLLGERHGQPCVVRLSHSAHRSFEEVAAEIAWMRELIEFGIKTPIPQRSANGEFCERLPAADSHFTAVAFSLLQGREITALDWNDRTFEAWGALVGRLHRRSQDARPAHARKPWHESDFLNIDRYISADDAVVRANSKALIEKIRSRPTSSPHYGLIHADIYQDNFRLLDTGELELFDFDNSEYGWFVSDLANALYAALWRVKDPVDRAAFPQRFLDRFLCGYARHYTLPSDELKLLPEFLRLRDVLIYTVGKKQLDPNRLTDIEIRMFGIRRSRIESQIPVVELMI